MYLCVSATQIEGAVAFHGEDASYVIRKLATSSCRRQVEQCKTGLITCALTMYRECP